MTQAVENLLLMATTTMKLTKKQLNKYNSPETLLVVSVYPRRGEVYSPGVTGVASYAKNVVTPMNQPVVILADTTHQDYGETAYVEDGNLVWRMFDNGHFKMLWQLWQAIRSFSNVKQVMVQHDFGMYQSLWVTAYLLPLLFLLRLTGKEITLVAHHVIVDIGKLKGHVGLGNGRWATIRAWGMSKLFQLYYVLMGVSVNRVVVLEDVLVNSLKPYISEHKLAVVPHGVDTQLEIPAKKLARKQLKFRKDEVVVMFFGFVNWFKGADQFVEAFSEVEMMDGKQVRFVIAGGESATLTSKSYYQEYFDKLTRAVDKSIRVEITGYIPQDQVAHYFSAADVVVFPYRTLMCASGVLSLTFSYEKPFVVSDAFGHMFEAEDMAKAMEELELEVDDMRFYLNRRDMVRTVERVVENGLKDKMRKLARKMKLTRSYAVTARQYETLLFEKQRAEAPGLVEVAYATVDW